MAPTAFDLFQNLFEVHIAFDGDEVWTIGFDAHFVGYMRGGNNQLELSNRGAAVGVKGSTERSSPKRKGENPFSLFHPLAASELHPKVAFMADIGSDAGLTREDGALTGASKLFSFLWSEAWEQVTATQAGDADALHDMRVAFRRLRTALQTFEGEKRAPVLSKPLRRELKEWRAAIGKLGDHLGAVRDFDVLTDYVRKFDTNHTEGLEKFAQILAHERGKQFAVMLGKLARANEGDGLRDQFARWSLGLPAARLQTPVSLEDIAHQLLPLRLEEATSLGSALMGDEEEAHHELRRSLRRLRYTLEMLSPCFAKPVKKPVKHLVEMQDLLGEMQDRAVLASWIKQGFKHAPSDVEAFAKHGDERHKELLAQVRDLWKKRESEGLWNGLKKLVPSTAE